MKSYKYRFPLLVLFLWAIITACKPSEITPDPSSITATNPNAEVNSWIYDEMKEWYLWTDKLPEKSKTDNTLYADLYFDSLLYQPGVVDRFSWIQESSQELKNSLSGKNTVLGIRSSAFFTSPTKTNLAFAIAYVLKGSPADKAGLKRGDFITKVNGTAITAENYQTAFSSESLSLTLGDYVNGEIIPNSKVINATKTEVQTNPIQFSTIVESGSKKIGYITYTQFIPGILKSNGSLGTEYDDELRTIFADFKAKGVNELVLDLRYNGGGYISSAVVLASLIGKNVNNSKIAYTDEWNAAKVKEFGGASVFKKYFKNESNNLGNLNRLFVLTSTGTASASELVINMLRPYMEVVLIGDHTYGKNVGSITISDEKSRWAWGMQPIVLKTYNANGESDYGSKTGFLPDVEVSDNKLPYQPLGDPSETLLKGAISYISGLTATATYSPNARLKSGAQFNQVSPFSEMDNPRANRYDMIAEPPSQK